MLAVQGGQHWPRVLVPVSDIRCFGESPRSPCTMRAVTIQQPSTATTPDSHKPELSPTPSVSWDSGLYRAPPVVRDEEALNGRPAV
jgi:hypothetical protein